MNADSSMLSTPPSHVPQDRVYEFDLYGDPRIAHDVHRGTAHLLEAAPDIFWTPRNGGHWIATRHAVVTQIMRAPHLFSNVDAAIEPGRPKMGLPLPPMDMDGEDHREHRRLLLPFLSPRAIKLLQPAMRQVAADAIDRLSGRRSCEFRSEVAVPIPVALFMKLMQFDIDGLDEVLPWVEAIVGGGDRDNIMPALMALSTYLSEIIAQRIARPGDDPISQLLRSTVYGERVSLKRVHEMCGLLFVAGLDTVTTAMTFTVAHLARNPEMQRSLRANRQEIPNAVEELLRRYSFINLPRRITADCELAGVRFLEGETIVCVLAAVANDPAAFPEPDEIDLARKNSPQIAFNIGPHSCVGAALARMELNIFLEEWLTRMPDVGIAPGFVPSTRGGAMMAIEALPLVW
jgi:cytochrome P450